MHFKTCMGHHGTSSIAELKLYRVLQLLNRNMEKTTRVFRAVAEIKKCADMGIDIVCILAMMMCDSLGNFYL